MKRIFASLFLVCLLLFSSVPNVSAASVGEILRTPEDSTWQRIDDSHEYIKYIGKGWNILDSYNVYYQNGRHQSNSTSLDDTIRIVFKGTKLRLISCMYPTYSNSININIDGIDETFSLAGSNHPHKVLVYEKQGLENKIHYVEISKKTSGTYDVDLLLDAIDIDSNGEILPPDTTITQPEPEPEPQPEPQPINDRAILTVTMTTGLEKEFDLTMSEVESFINWYDAKENGTGPAKYGINKHNNNKGPFSKRTDYVIFKNILSFEVSEYSTVTSATYSQ